MRACAIALKDFRNYRELRLNFHEGLNIIFGSNAQGKTNLLEALYYFVAARSFRGVSDKDLVRLGESGFEIDLSLFGGGREQNIAIRLNRETGRSVLLNGVKKTKRADLVGVFCGVLFSPEHLSLIKNGPGERRRFVDLGLSQLKPVYFKALDFYGKVLAQKHALLRTFLKESHKDELLDVYNKQLAAAAATVMAERASYLALLDEEAGKKHAEISEGREALSLGYLPSVETDDFINREDLRERIFEGLTAGKIQEQRAGTSLFGIHRDRIEVFINRKDARLFASQGQQRSAVLAMKAAECELFRQITGETPILLLDDILSELDEARQRYVLNQLHDKQVFVTCCDPRLFDGLTGGRRFLVEAGRVSDL